MITTELPTPDEESGPFNYSIKPPKNPARVAAGCINAQRRRTWTAEQRDAARQRALAQKPWKQSTGPRSTYARNQSAANLRKATLMRLLKRIAKKEATPEEHLLALSLLVMGGIQ